MRSNREVYIFKRYLLLISFFVYLCKKTKQKWGVRGENNIFFSFIYIYISIHLIYIYDLCPIMSYVLLLIYYMYIFLSSECCPTTRTPGGSLWLSWSRRKGVPGRSRSVFRTVHTDSTLWIILAFKMRKGFPYSFESLYLHILSDLIELYICK